MRSKTCPLCGEIARYTKSSYSENNKCYYCNHCFNFIISKSAEELISKFPKEQRFSYSDKSKKAFISQVLVIDAIEADGQKSIDFKYDPESNWY